MLRNVHRSKQPLRHIEWQTKGCANISTSCAGVGTTFAKANIVNFQGRIMSKLIGHRVSGSKKRWIPVGDNNTANSTKQNAEIFSSKKVASGNNGSKNTTRRMAVLNKLFMKHITDLLATGEASEAILGRGLQVTRVKISPDFTSINVYWLGNGEAMADAALETELRRCSGVLRHELSQLMLMGEVPRITFAREKKLTNIGDIEGILRSIDFTAIEEADTADDGSCDESRGEQPQRDHYNLVANMMQREFYGKSALSGLKENTADAVIADANEEEFPEMRHDVLGLDHQHIMSKLLTKMRKSQQAWDEHTQREERVINNAAADGEPLELVQQKLAEAAEKAERFEKFLAKRHDRRNTPERKRHDRASEWIDENVDKAVALEAAEAYAALTPKQRELLEAEDYLYEDHDRSDEKSKK